MLGGLTTFGSRFTVTLIIVAGIFLSFFALGDYLRKVGYKQCLSDNSISKLKQGLHNAETKNRVSTDILNLPPDKLDEWLRTYHSPNKVRSEAN